jgi:hypothetical protein
VGLARRRAACSGVTEPRRTLDHGLAERPKREQSDAKRRDSERDRDDQDETDQRRKRVADTHPQAGKDEPDDVQGKPQRQSEP